MHDSLLDPDEPPCPLYTDDFNQELSELLTRHYGGGFDTDWIEDDDGGFELTIFEYDDPYFDREEYVAEVMSSVAREKFERHGLRLIECKERRDD